MRTGFQQSAACTAFLALATIVSQAQTFQASDLADRSIEVRYKIGNLERVSSGVIVKEGIVATVLEVVDPHAIYSVNGEQVRGDFINGPDFFILSVPSAGKGLKWIGMGEPEIGKSVSVYFISSGAKAKFHGSVIGDDIIPRVNIAGHPEIIGGGIFSGDMLVGLSAGSGDVVPGTILHFALVSLNKHPPPMRNIRTKSVSASSLELP